MNSVGGCSLYIYGETNSLLVSHEIIWYSKIQLSIRFLSNQDRFRGLETIQLQRMAFIRSTNMAIMLKTHCLLGVCGSSINGFVAEMRIFYAIEYGRIMEMEAVGNSVLNNQTLGWKTGQILYENRDYGTFWGENVVFNMQCNSRVNTVRKDSKARTRTHTRTQWEMCHKRSGRMFLWFFTTHSNGNSIPFHIFRHVHRLNMKHFIFIINQWLTLASSHAKQSWVHCSKFIRDVYRPSREQQQQQRRKNV